MFMLPTSSQDEQAYWNLPTSKPNLALPEARSAFVGERIDAPEPNAMRLPKRLRVVQTDAKGLGSLGVEVVGAAVSKHTAVANKDSESPKHALRASSEAVANQSAIGNRAGMSSLVHVLADDRRVVQPLSGPQGPSANSRLSSL